MQVEEKAGKRGPDGGAGDHLFLLTGLQQNVISWVSSLHKWLFLFIAVPAAG